MKVRFPRASWPATRRHDQQAERSFPVATLVRARVTFQAGPAVLLEAGQPRAFNERSYRRYSGSAQLPFCALSISQHLKRLAQTHVVGQVPPRPSREEPASLHRRLDTGAVGPAPGCPLLRNARRSRSSARTSSSHWPAYAGPLALFVRRWRCPAHLRPLEIGDQPHAFEESQPSLRHLSTFFQWASACWSFSDSPQSIGPDQHQTRGVEQSLPFRIGRGSPSRVAAPKNPAACRRSRPVARFWPTRTLTRGRGGRPAFHQSGAAR